jgi:hypothetical protein
MKKDKRRKEHKLAGRCRGFGAPTRVYVRDWKNVWSDAWGLPSSEELESPQRNKSSPPLTKCWTLKKNKRIQSNVGHNSEKLKLNKSCFVIVMSHTTHIRIKHWSDINNFSVQLITCQP